MSKIETKKFIAVATDVKQVGNVTVKTEKFGRTINKPANIKTDVKVKS
jgi:hypothetical protein